MSTNTPVDLPLRSVSQLNQYVRCPQAYKLGRIDKVWARPAAWLPQGTAFHAVAEEHEKRFVAGNPMTIDEAKDMFKAEYAAGINELCDVTPNFEWWFWSGPYNGERDIGDVPGGDQQRGCDQDHDDQSGDGVRR